MVYNIFVNYIFKYIKYMSVLCYKICCFVMLYRVKEMRFVYTGFTEHLHEYIDHTEHCGRTFNITSCVNFKNNFGLNNKAVSILFWLIMVDIILIFLKYIPACSMRRVESAVLSSMLVSLALHYHNYMYISLNTNNTNNNYNKFTCYINR